MFWGKFIKAIGLKKTTVITLFAAAVSAAAYGNSTTPTMYLITLICMVTLINAFALICGMSITTNWFPTKKGIVMGLTTAAGMWSTAAIGIAVGYGFYLGAIVATAICIFTATGLSRLEKRRKNVTHFYAEITADENTDNIVEAIRAMEDGDIAVDIVLAKSNTSGRLGLIIDIRNPKSSEIFKCKVAAMEGVCLLIEEKI